MVTKKVFSGIFLILCFSLVSQNISLGVKYFGLSIHPFGAINSNIMPLKLDPEGVLVLNTGLSFGVEYFIPRVNFISIKFVQGIYFDCIGQFAGFSHLGIRFHFPTINGFSVNGGIGPSLIFRKNWYEVPGYDDSFSFFNGDRDDFWQWRFLWYGGEFEFNQNITEKMAISETFIPGYPDLMNLSIGIKYSI
jgi:hypothetical protein